MLHNHCNCERLKTQVNTFWFRWKTDERGERVTNQITGRPILQFVAIQRADSGEWALPGVSY